MKKTYIAPDMKVVVINIRHHLLMVSGLDGFEGNGGNGSGLEADGREGFFDEDEY